MTRGEFRKRRAKRCALPCVLALFAYTLAACAGLPPVPSKGGPAWREMESEHFVLMTDLPSDRAHETIRQMEHVLAGLLTVGWQVRGEFPAKLTAIVFADQGDRKEFSPNYGGFMFQRPMESPVAVMAAPSYGEGTDTLVHELTHEIAYLAMKRQPPWFSEGIATFFETATVERDGTFVVGGVPTSFGWLRRESAMPVRELMAADTNRDDWRFYGSAWLLVHYLMMRHGDAFSAYQQALARGERFEDAWRMTLGVLTPDALERNLADYREDGAFQRFGTRVAAPSVRARLRLMTDADVYAMRALLYANCYGCGTDKRRLAPNNVALALNEDPNHLGALLARFHYAQTREEGLAIARRAVAAHPDDWRAWHTLAFGLVLRINPEMSPPPPEWGAAVDRALTLAPKQPVALGMAALRMHFSGDDAQALELSGRAVRLHPTDKFALGLRVLVLFLAHRCDEVAGLTVRLAHAINHDLTPGLLDKVRAACERRATSTPQP